MGSVKPVAATDAALETAMIVASSKQPRPLVQAEAYARLELAFQ